jgi:hypothetical protein
MDELLYRNSQSYQVHFERCLGLAVPLHERTAAFGPEREQLEMKTMLHAPELDWTLLKTLLVLQSSDLSNIRVLNAFACGHLEKLSDRKNLQFQGLGVRD